MTRVLYLHADGLPDRVSKAPFAGFPSLDVGRNDHVEHSAAKRSHVKARDGEGANTGLYIGRTTRRRANAN
jgi:hypothetical protein